jgi:hypothetical protein
LAGLIEPERNDFGIRTVRFNEMSSFLVLVERLINQKNDIRQLDALVLLVGGASFTQNIVITVDQFVRDIIGSAEAV